MKRFKIWASITIAVSMVIFISSCNNGEDKNDDTAAADTSAAKTMEPKMEPAPAAKPGNFLIITAKVASYGKWLPVYEADDSVRIANGLSNYVLGRGSGSDSNTVLVALKMADVTKAKTFTGSSLLKEKMKKSGVIGAPVSINFVESVMIDTSTNSLTSRVIVTHRVKDWDAWKKEFDSHKQSRIDAGLTDRSVGHFVDDTHTVTLVFAINDMEKAKAFMASKDLKDKMAAAGVEGPPTVFYYTVAKKY
jgi:hypothetical protein